VPAPNELTATAMAAAIAKGELSAEALMQAHLQRIAERDEDVRAWAYIDPDHAMQQAVAADQLAASSASLGPLHGLPVGIKDIIDTNDMPTQHGSALFEGRRPENDAACVAALRAAGAIIIGKTVTTELANTNPSITRNPHNLAHTPGGSSAGSGAGVADFQIPLALGTQTGGSVIRPGSFNGVYALKPSLGLIPRAGVLLQSHTLDTVGVYARSLEDLAFITDSLSMPESRDALSYRGSRENLQAAFKQPAAQVPRLALLHTPAWDECHEAAKLALTAAAAKLDANTVQLPSPYDRIIDLHGAIFSGENAHYYGQHLRERPHLMSDKLRARMEAASDRSAGDYVEAICLRDVIYADLEALLSRFDAVLCLSSLGPAPEGFETTGSAAMNSPWTYLGVPCVSLPKLEVDGLPVGLQLVGLRGAEAKLMRTAAWVDKALP
jgi:Asp-tRNA(Asn)/Glu-tRNA(Gln) amidotransferase A subunit family amidase